MHAGHIGRSLFYDYHVGKEYVCQKPGVIGKGAGWRVGEGIFHFGWVKVCLGVLGTDR